MLKESHRITADANADPLRQKQTERHRINKWKNEPTKMVRRNANAKTSLGKKKQTMVMTEMEMMMFRDVKALKGCR